MKQNKKIKVKSSDNGTKQPKCKTNLAKLKWSSSENDYFSPSFWFSHLVIK